MNTTSYCLHNNNGNYTYNSDNINTIVMELIKNITNELMLLIKYSVDPHNYNTDHYKIIESQKINNNSITVDEYFYDIKQHKLYNANKTREFNCCLLPLYQYSITRIKSLIDQTPETQPQTNTQTYNQSQTNTLPQTNTQPLKKEEGTEPKKKNIAKMMRNFKGRVNFQDKKSIDPVYRKRNEKKSTDEFDVNELEDINDIKELEKKLLETREQKQKQIKETNEILKQKEMTLSDAISENNFASREKQRIKEINEERERIFNIDKKLFTDIKYNNQPIPKLYAQKYPVFDTLDFHGMIDEMNLFITLFNIVHEKNLNKGYHPNDIFYYEPEEGDVYKHNLIKYEDTLEKLSKYYTTHYKSNIELPLIEDEHCMFKQEANKEEESDEELDGFNSDDVMDSIRKVVQYETPKDIF